MVNILCIVILVASFESSFILKKSLSPATSLPSHHIFAKPFLFTLKSSFLKFFRLKTLTNSGLDDRKVYLLLQFK